MRAGRALRWSAPGASQLVRLASKGGGGRCGGPVPPGLAYDTGIGVKRDCSRAADWYRKAANSGNPGAQNNLAGLYLRA
jgi:TPR repeat protein